MEKFEQKIKQLLEMMGFEDFSLNHFKESGQLSVFISDKTISETNLPAIVGNFDCVLRLILQKSRSESGETIEQVYVDVNNYRKKRESLILELAKAMAKRAVIEKKEMPLPAMNAYERRLIHTELVQYPDIKTESAGEGRGRYVVIKPI
ncbi:hypothetical protein HZB04_00420 [Candidatus Wolfebacteria bacterium]|nr:hypothetical protein [Candidatus Wolfebacteria bacterium]